MIWITWIIIWIFSQIDKTKFRRTFISYEIHNRNEVNKDSHHNQKGSDWLKKLNSHSLDLRYRFASILCVCYIWVKNVIQPPHQTHYYTPSPTTNCVWCDDCNQQPSPPEFLPTYVITKYRNSPHQWFTPNRFHGNHSRLEKSVRELCQRGWNFWVSLVSYTAVVVYIVCAGCVCGFVIVWHFIEENIFIRPGMEWNVS